MFLCSVGISLSDVSASGLVLTLLVGRWPCALTFSRASRLSGPSWKGTRVRTSLECRSSPCLSMTLCLSVQYSRYCTLSLLWTPFLSSWLLVSMATNTWQSWISYNLFLSCNMVWSGTGMYVNMSMATVAHLTHRLTCCSSSWRAASQTPWLGVRSCSTTTLMWTLSTSTQVVLLIWYSKRYCTS